MRSNAAAKPTCYLLRADVELKQRSDGRALVLQSFTAVTTSLPETRRVTVKPHEAELHVLSSQGLLI